jgi:hypothetical protein
MKKNILFIAVGIVFCINAMGQIHKTKGDKPLFSHHYTFENSNDSTPETKTIYIYNNNQQLTKEIRLPLYFFNQGDDIDSTVKTYNVNDRIISSIVYVKDTISYSEKWVYDTVNKRIDYYDFTDASFDSVTHIIYKGVNSFDKVPEPIASDFFVNSLLETIIDCDTILVSEYNDTTFSWNVVTEIYPFYHNGKLDSTQVKIKNFDASMFGIPNMIFNISLDLKFTYSGNKLMNIKGDMELENLSLPFPSSFPNAITITNQYKGNLLIESKTELKISIPFVGMLYTGIKQQYAYNSDDNISVMVQEDSQNETSWIVGQKTYYYYNEDNIEDIVLIHPSTIQLDTIGTPINIEVSLENKSHLTVFQNVNITAIIQDAQRNVIETLTDTIDKIYYISYLSHTFTRPYFVPDDTVYFITVYIDSYDSMPLNDTIRIKCYTGDDIKDLVLVSINEPPILIDTISTLVNIEVSLENKSFHTVFQDVNITAIIQDAQKNVIATLTDTIDQIHSISSVLHTFTEPYIVPDDTVYFITIYIDSYDSMPLNDTVRLKRQTNKDFNDLALDSIQISPPHWGNPVYISVILENKSRFVTHNNISMTALIRNSKGETVATFTGGVDQIAPLYRIPYRFNDSYTSPIHDYFFVTVYIDSDDNNPINDTIRIKYEIPINVKSIDNVTIYMDQNIPNPANKHTLITYSIPTNGTATFSVYSMKGKLLFSQSVDATSGENTLKLNTEKLASGLYLYTMEFNGRRIVKKMNISR